MTNKTNLELYEQRKEPEILRPGGRGYLNLRTNHDLDLITGLESLLRGLSKDLGEECVLASWISPPFGRICGYGTYTRKEAQDLSDRSKRERWGFPRFGSIHDISRLERKIKRLKPSYDLSPSPSY